MKHITYPALALCAVLAAGCHEAPSSVENDTAMQISEDFSVRMLNPGPTPGYEFSKEERKQLSEANVEALRTFAGILRTASDWERAHEAVLRELASPSEIPQRVREQVAATLMLRNRLLGQREETNPAKHEAVAYYTELLVKNGSPEGPEIVRALRVLRSYWSEDQVAEAASSAAVATEAFLEKRLNQSRPVSKIPTSDLREALVDQQDVFLDQAVSALDDLRQMSGS